MVSVFLTELLEDQWLLASASYSHSTFYFTSITIAALGKGYMVECCCPQDHFTRILTFLMHCLNISQFFISADHSTSLCMFAYSLMYLANYINMGVPKLFYTVY